MSSAQERANRALSVPLLEFLDVSLVEPEEPASGLSLAPTRNSLNAVGLPHAGALSTVLELAAYLALRAEMHETEEAVTHQFSASYLARASGRAVMVAQGQVLRRTRNLGFVAVTLLQEDRLLATAQVIKSIFATD